MVSGHTCIPASIRFADVGDPQSPILHNSLSEESDKTEPAHHDFTSPLLKYHLDVNWMKSDDKNQINYFLAEIQFLFSNHFNFYFSCISF